MELKQKDLQDLEYKKAEKLKTKALRTFDVLMNEEVALERILSKCVFISQSSKGNYRQKAIKHLASDLIPSFLPGSQQKLSKFVKSSQKILSDLKLNVKKTPIKRKATPINSKENSENYDKSPILLKNYEEKVMSDADIEERLQVLDEKLRVLRGLILKFS